MTVADGAAASLRGSTVPAKAGTNVQLVDPWVGVTVVECAAFDFRPDTVAPMCGP